MTSIKFTSNKIVKAAQQGFTLIELLIVIAVLGVLAAVVLVAINPTEQLARARDSSRLQEVAQLGGAMQAWKTAIGNGTPMTVAAAVAAGGFQSALVASQDIQSVLTNPTASYSILTYRRFDCTAVATSNAQNNFCYSPTATGFLIWTAAESALYNAKVPCTVGTSDPFFVYDSSLGKSGTECLAATGTIPPVGGPMF